MMLIVQDVDDDKFVDAVETLEEGAQEDKTAVINAILGEQGAAVLRVEGFIKKQRVVFLIDTSSSHNVLHSSLVKRLHLPVRTSQVYRVGVAGGRTLKVSKTYANLQWFMAGSTFADDFMVLDIGHFDAILGVQWLRHLGRIIMDLESHFIAFHYQGHYFELHGLGTVDKPPLEGKLGHHELLRAQHVFLIQGAPH